MYKVELQLFHCGLAGRRDVRYVYRDDEGWAGLGWAGLGWVINVFSQSGGKVVGVASFPLPEVHGVLVLFVQAASRFNTAGLHVEYASLLKHARCYLVVTASLYGDSVVKCLLTA